MALPQKEREVGTLKSFQTNGFIIGDGSYRHEDTQWGDKIWQ
jgi:hypothetical protein